MTTYTIYDVTVSVLTPLHIGSGKDLLNEYDYAIRDGRTWRLNEGALLDAQDVEDSDTAALLGRTPPAQLLQEGDFLRPDSGFFRYVLAGMPRSQAAGAQLREQIKDAFDRPYLPGSSFKGALRTALAWNAWRIRGMRADIGKFGRRRQWAGQPLEREIFGRGPNQDFLRALHVSDSAPVGTDRLLILNASVIGSGGKAGAPIEMEAIAPDTQFRLTIKIDDALFSDWAIRHQLRLEGKDLLTTLPRAVQSHSLAFARRELAWFKGISTARQVAGFYQKVVEARLRSNRFLICLGWGTGWTSKTFGPLLQEEPGLMDHILREFRLGRGHPRAGDPFPKSRRAVIQVARDSQGRLQENPVTPFGWCLVEMKERRS